MFLWPLWLFVTFFIFGMILKYYAVEIQYGFHRKKSDYRTKKKKKRAMRVSISFLDSAQTEVALYNFWCLRYEEIITATFSFFRMFQESPKKISYWKVFYRGLIKGQLFPYLMFFVCRLVSDIPITVSLSKAHNIFFITLFLNILHWIVAFPWSLLELTNKTFRML